MIIKVELSIMFDMQHTVWKLSPEELFINGGIDGVVNGFFLWILRDFLEHLLRIPSVTAFDHCQENNKCQHCKRNAASVNVNK